MTAAKVGKMEKRRPQLEVLDHRPKTIADQYIHITKITNRGIGVGRPRKYGTKEELIVGIQAYFDDIVNHDGSYNRPPTWTGLGLHLGFASKKWDDNYRDTDEFGWVISQTRLLIDTWRKEQAAVPGKGVNPAGIMFLMNREEQQAQHYHDMKDITPTAEDNRPTDAAAIIDEVWSKRDKKDGTDSNT
jgi:hypothetical protein